MTPRLPRYRTGRPELDELLVQLLDAAGTTENRDQLFEILATAVRLATDTELDRLDLKITNTALKEMRTAFKVFSPYRDKPKVTMFGSARTHSEDPLYLQARDLAEALADEGWMVVTGAGPGIMAAGLEGAGRKMSFGINIRLPFEQGANEFIAKDPKLVEMKYFFTRKLMLIKEVDGFVVLPGGFGTLDETFELLTLVQTGKAEPVPIVLLEVPGGNYWREWEEFVMGEVATRGLISPEDSCLYLITDDVALAREEILGFYRNYHSLRYVGDRLVLRVKREPTDDELSLLNEEFSAISTDGTIVRGEPSREERRDDDFVDLPRVTLAFDRTQFARLRRLIDSLNALGSAPDEPPSRKGADLA